MKIHQATNNYQQLITGRLLNLTIQKVVLRVKKLTVRFDTIGRVYIQMYGTYSD